MSTFEIILLCFCVGSIAEPQCMVQLQAVLAFWGILLMILPTTISYVQVPVLSHKNVVASEASNSRVFGLIYSIMVQVKSIYVNVTWHQLFTGFSWNLSSAILMEFCVILVLISQYCYIMSLSAIGQSRELCDPFSLLEAPQSTSYSWVSQMKYMYKFRLTLTKFLT